MSSPKSSAAKGDNTEMVSKNYLKLSALLEAWHRKEKFEGDASPSNRRLSEQGAQTERERPQATQETLANLDKVARDKEKNPEGRSAHQGDAAG